jgi:hypothetical protein
MYIWRSEDKAMSIAELAEQIAALPAPSRAQVERLVSQLSHSLPDASSGDFVERARAIRERIFTKHGFLGNVSDDVRRLRENGR